jgi:SMODS-associated and fused to various effectors sensor domain
MLFWKPWLDAMAFGFEVQSVVALRLLKIAAGGAEGNAEVTKMVTEKVEALAEAQTAGAIALAQGKSVKVASKRAIAPIKRRVRANHRRLKKVNRRPVSAGHCKDTGEHPTILRVPAGPRAASPSPQCPRGPKARCHGWARRSFMHPIDDIEARCDESVNLVPHFDGRYIRDQAGWKADVLPELQRFLIESARDNDQLRLILDTHVSLAFGVGAILNVKSGKNIEIEQRAAGRHIWSAADKPLDPAWPTLCITEETVHVGGPDLAVAVSMAHDVAPAVRCYVQKVAAIGTLMTASPEDGPSYQSVRSDSHAAAMVSSLLGPIRATVRRGPRRVHLFIAGPNAFAFFLGQSQAAIGAVSIYEWDFDGLRDGGYSVGLELP